MSSVRPQRRKRRKIRWTRVILLLVFLITVLTSFSWAAVYTYKKFTSTPVVATKMEERKRIEPVSKYINILLLGVDEGDNEHPGAPRRSDTMIVASIDPEAGKVNLLSIPRDTKAAIPGHKGTEKITHAFFYGGPNLAMRTVEELLEIPIHHFVVIDWQAFIETIDILGGVDLYVESNMNYEDPYANLAIHLVRGYQHLDGSQSGQYVRFRSDELGDIGRVQRQQRFLKALTEQTLQFGNVLKLPKFVQIIKEHITTDVSGVEMLKLANQVRKIKSGEVSAEMLPGNFATIDGLSYWVHNKEQTKQLVERMLVNDYPQVSGIVTP